MAATLEVHNFKVCISIGRPIADNLFIHEILFMEIAKVKQGKTIRKINKKTNNNK